MASSRLASWLLAAVLAAAAVPFWPACMASAGDLVNPVLGDTEAIAEGRRIYRSRCYICHLSQGGRGPNLFASSLSDEQFLEVVINGRKGATMPAFGTLLSPDDIWKVHAYVKSTSAYE